MMPPANSAFDLNLQPKMPPILMPAAEKAKVVMPMRAADKKIFTFKKAKVIPTARASILVATAMTNMVLKAKELLTASSSAAKGFFYHVETNQKEKDKGYPMVKGRYVLHECAAE